MAAFGLLSCIGPVLLLGLLVGSVRTLWLTLMPPSRMPRTAACGQCGYSVEGSTTLSCPECGADWRLSGITTPGLIMRYRGSTTGAILAWTILMGSAALFAVSIVGVTYATRAMTTMRGGPQTWSTPLTPASQAYQKVEISTTVSMGASTADAVKLALTLNNGDAWTLELDPATRRATTTGASGARSTKSYASGDVAAFFGAAGLDTTNTAVAAELKELETVVEVERISPYSQPSSMSLSQFTAGTPSFSGANAFASQSSGMATMGIAMLFGGVLCLLIYIVGIVVIVRRRASLLGRYASQPVYSPGI